MAFLTVRFKLEEFALWQIANDLNPEFASETQLAPRLPKPVAKRFFHQE